MLHRVMTSWTRSAAVLAVLALAIQPCALCLTGAGPAAAIAAPSHAAHATDDCGAPGPVASGEHAAAPGSAQACPTLSARSPDNYVPATAVPALPSPVAPLALAAPAPSLQRTPAAPDAFPKDPVPPFLRHASFRI
jgi:hypothetical protein